MERLEPQAVVLFGSFARGDVHEASDLDLLVVADFPEPFLERIGRLLELASDLELPLEPVGYTSEEVVAMWQQGNRFPPGCGEDGAAAVRFLARGNRCRR